MEYNDIELETHPWEPYIPEHAKVLVMGTFPPQSKRWAMNFYYPSRTNDFWYMMGLIFYGDRTSLLREGSKDFDLDKIKRLLNEKGIALNDTGHKIRRLRGNASENSWNRRARSALPTVEKDAGMPLHSYHRRESGRCNRRYNRYARSQNGRDGNGPGRSGNMAYAFHKPGLSSEA